MGSTILKINLTLRIGPHDGAFSRLVFSTCERGDLALTEGRNCHLAGGEAGAGRGTAVAVGTSSGKDCHVAPCRES